MSATKAQLQQEAAEAARSEVRPKGDIESHLADAASLFRLAVERSNAYFVILNEDAHIVHANPACCLALGRQLAELLLKPVRATGLVPRRASVYRELLKSVDTQGEWRGEYESSARFGEPRILHVSVSRLVTPHGARYVVEARDVTHQRRLEYIADAANLVENTGYVFAGLRHELGNPINSIKTALSVMQQSLPNLSRERISSYLDSVLAEVGRVEYLLRCMATFNSTQHPVPEPVDVLQFLIKFVRIIRPDVERRGVDLLVSCAEGSGFMLADPQALHQVLLNLVTNALDALDGKTTGVIRIAATRRADHVRIVVSDNGPGIRPERRAHVFKPFHTTKRKGTGLGLAITRKLVTLMRGTIEHEVPSTGGASFVITLEVMAPAALHTWRPS
jgi:PAS domain S-box-containing protein